MRIESHLPKVAPLLRKIAAGAVPREACGYLTKSGQLGEMPNRSSEPTEMFNMGALDEITALEGEIAAIWHTHPEDVPPSAPDIEGCKATWLPWIIASPARVWVLHPEGFPYVGRDFIYGVTDCWQLVADWYAQERTWFLPWIDRPADGWWETSGVSPYLELAPFNGFKVTPYTPAALSSLAVGDMILMRVRGHRTNHAAVYLGGGNILHHLHGLLSRIEQLDSKWQRFITHIARPILP